MLVDIRLGPGEDPRQIEKSVAEASAPTCMPWRYATDMLELPGGTNRFSLLDIGAGASSLVPRLLERGVDAYAIDPKYQDIPGLIRQAEGRNYTFKQTGQTEEFKARRSALEMFQHSARRHPDRYIPAYASSLPFEDERFDVVCSIGTASQFLDWDLRLLVETAEESLRKTKKGGTVQYSPWGESDLVGVAHVDQVRMEAQAALIDWLHNNPLVTSFRFRQMPASYKFQLTTLVIERAV